MQLYGKDWKKIEALIATRNGAQIRSHAQKHFIKAKKEDDPDAEHSPELLSPVTQLSASDADYSYFLSKIVGRFCGEEEFDFWSHLVDHKQGSADTAEPRRKNSFVSLASETGEEGFMPCKRVKSE